MLGDVLAVLAGLLVMGGFIAILLVAARASKAQRARTRPTSFGGRYSDFGFLLGILRSGDRDAEDEPRGRDADR